MFWQKVFVFFDENMYVDMQTHGQADGGWAKDWEVDKIQTEANMHQAVIQKIEHRDESMGRVGGYVDATLSG
jgi:hypothetical protein